jgi:hypothetical protein
MRRIAALPPPWTNDSVLSRYKFTNVYRASDRVSQYLIRHVLYDGQQTADEVFFRALLFKLFNRIETWEELTKTHGPPSWKAFKLERYASTLDKMLARGERVYSGAYIMPSPPYFEARKHRNHLRLLDFMMRDAAAKRVENAKSLADVFEILRAYPSLGDFLAFQFAIDLNYSQIINFSEMDFVVAGPGARDGIRKCFYDTGGLNDSDVIKVAAEFADQEFERLQLAFRTLWGRKLQLIDCQNLFCEVDKYARVTHPTVTGLTGRSRIKQKFSPSARSLPQWYPPKWGLKIRRNVK